MSWKGFGRKRSQLNLLYSTRIFLKKLIKIMMNLLGYSMSESEYETGKPKVLRKDSTKPKTPLQTIFQNRILTEIRTDFGHIKWHRRVY
jgi:hypothetical protein